MKPGINAGLYQLTNQCSAFLDFDVAPKNIGGSVMVPLWAIFEALSAATIE